MGLKEIIESANNMLDRTNELMGKADGALHAAKSTYDIAKNTFDTANNALEGVNDVREHYRTGREYYNSVQGQKDFAETQKYLRRSGFVSKLMVILWAVVIVGTIVLCITGNDIILKVLHL